jgi:hypothetical protein
MRGTDARASEKYRPDFAWLGICSTGDCRPTRPSLRAARWQEGVADMFKCAKCGKTSPKFTNCCGTPMKKG